jgi:hypothetical protein
MKKVVWQLLETLEKDGKINLRDISNNGCLENNQSYPLANTRFKVIDSWSKKLKQLENNKCCKLIEGSVIDAPLDKSIQNDFLRLSHKDEQTREICMKVRGQDCRDNFRGELLNRCLLETDKLCKIGYPENKLVGKQVDLVTKVRADLLEKVKKNNNLVSRQLFDELVTAGMLSNVGERLRNANTNINLVKGVFTDRFEEKGLVRQMINPRRIERFEGINNNNSNYWLILIILIVVLIGYYLL